MVARRRRSNVRAVAVATAVMVLSVAPNPCTASVPDSPSRQNAAADAWSPPDPPASSERRRERLAMVDEQIASPGDLREPVDDPRVLEAMRTVPRHVFMPDDVRAMAYRDTPLPIGHGQTISQPYIVALMTQLLDVEAGDRVLEIGTGSGYQAAVLGQLTPHVYSIEILEPLAERARRVLDEQGCAHVSTRQGDGYFGWPEHAPFDGIIVTAAAGHVPPPLWEQLAPGGRLVIPIGGTYQVQRLVVLSKTMDGERRSETVLSVRFVPMTGRAQE
jgi:protein-L-isoaspartate(D-aspartate) O-methyltransferase